MKLFIGIIKFIFPCSIVYPFKLILSIRRVSNINKMKVPKTNKKKFIKFNKILAKFQTYKVR